MGRRVIVQAADGPRLTLHGWRHRATLKTLKQGGLRGNVLWAGRGMLWTWGWGCVWLVPWSRHPRHQGASRTLERACPDQPRGQRGRSGQSHRLPDQTDWPSFPPVHKYTYMHKHGCPSVRTRQNVFAARAIGVSPPRGAWYSHGLIIPEPCSAGHHGQGGFRALLLTVVTRMSHHPTCGERGAGSQCGKCEEDLWWRQRWSDTAKRTWS